jgi:ferritin-like metal-binding protein YciE/hemerythrin superfamily protein
MRTHIADRGRGEPISLGAALLAGKKVPPDVTQLLMDDHRVVLGWFRWYQQTEDGDVKLRLARRIFKALRAHMAAEEEILYAAARVQTKTELVERAQHEHDEAKALMERLESARSADEAHTRSMVELESEIRAHVDEEEADLFPAVRETDIDLYAVGRSVAARRVDHLFHATAGSETDQQKEYPNMQISQDEARDFFIMGLKNAHGTASQARTMAKAQVKRLEQYPDLKRRFEAHVREKDAQLERLEGILSSCGEKPSTVKDTIASALATAASAADSAASDEIIKNGFNALALAKYEGAAYETLILFAEAAGEHGAMRPLQQSLSEQRGMAAFVEENLRPTGMRFLQLRSEGAQASH